MTYLIINNFAIDIFFVAHPEFHFSVCSIHKKSETWNKVALTELIFSTLLRGASAEHMAKAQVCFPTKCPCVQSNVFNLINVVNIYLKLWPYK